MVNALELAEELQARTDFSERDARGVVYAISRAIEATTAKLVTSDQLDGRMSELRAEMAELRGEVRSEIAAVKMEIATLRVEMHQAIRAQTIWTSSTIIAVAGVMIAAMKFIP